MKRIKLAFMGFGNAAQAFAKIVVDKKEDLALMGFDICATVVVTATKGNCYVAEGLALEKLLSDIDLYGKFVSEGMGVTSQTGMELLEIADYDVLLELSPLDIHTGQPAIRHIQTAFYRHKSVITANKGPLAWAYKALQQLALDQQVTFLFETTVMDGTPIFNLHRESLQMCQVTGIKGILNTTTNFILESMEVGMAYEEAMEEGRRRGFVEADPSLDIDGFDSAAKLCALVNVLMAGDIDPTQVLRTGISGISLEDIKAAKASGHKIKLLCMAETRESGIYAEVKPTLVPYSDAYASINGTSSVLTMTTDLMGALTIIEHDPEIQQTGFGIFNDLLTLLKSSELK
jgi:homoserine dehydrogenase